MKNKILMGLTVICLLLVTGCTSNTDEVDLNITEKMYVTYINEIYTNSDSYLGKRLKIEGMFLSEYLEETDTTYPPRATTPRVAA